MSVSLGLAIGRFALGKTEQSIETFIIDEGFGCLDRRERGEMASRRNDLNGRLSRIILIEPCRRP